MYYFCFIYVMIPLLVLFSKRPIVQKYISSEVFQEFIFSVKLCKTRKFFYSEKNRHGEVLFTFLSTVGGIKKLR